MLLVNRLAAIYDLRVSPSSFDFVSFLIGAEYFRTLRKLDSIDLFVLLVGPKHGGFRGDKFRGHLQNQMFFHNVILPSAGLMPSIANLHFLKGFVNLERYGQEIYPPGWSIKTPTAGFLCEMMVVAEYLQLPFSGLSAPEYALKTVQDLFAEIAPGRRVVTLTSRELEREDPEKKRSIREDEWVRFAEKWAIPNGYIPILVRDTKNQFLNEIFEPYHQFNVFSSNLHLRTALYELSDLNFFKPNGPLGLSMFNYKSRSIVFFEPDSNASTSEKWYLQRYNMCPGDSFPQTTNRTLWVWKEDSFRNIVSSAELLMQRLKDSPALTRNTTPSGWDKRPFFGNIVGKYLSNT